MSELRTLLAFDWDARTIDRLGYGCANRDADRMQRHRRPGRLCTACALTRTRPPDPALIQWSVAEAAKRRLVFELLELGLPIDGGLTFDMLSSAHAPVVTGHADGVITLDLAETDPVHREQTRTELDEPYRTVLGHLRHEIGHYYQPILVRDWDRCRAALRRRPRGLPGRARSPLREGPPADWPHRYVSAYATMHPWEDWAETFAHYLHIRDVLQTAVAYGVSVSGPALATSDATPLYSYPGAAPDDFRAMLDAWFPLTYALNAINRSLGESDLYPFVLAPGGDRQARIHRRLDPQRVIGVGRTSGKTAASGVAVATGAGRQSIGRASPPAGRRAQSSTASADSRNRWNIGDLLGGAGGARSQDPVRTHGCPFAVRRIASRGGRRVMSLSRCTG